MAAEKVYQGAQEAAMAAYETAMQLGEELEKLLQAAEEAVKMAEEGLLQAGEYAVQFAADAEKLAKQALEDSKQLLASTEEIWNSAQDAAEDALNSAINAVGDFLDKISGGFFNALMDIFEYHKQTNTLAWHYEWQRMQAARRWETQYAQSRSPNQTLAMSSSRRLQGFWDLETIFDGIVGALSFIQDKLNEAVSFAEDAIEVVKETAEQQIAAVEDIVELAAGAIAGAVQAGIDGAKMITDAAEDALNEAIRFVDGEIIQKAKDAANSALEFAEDAANAAADALESAIDAAKGVYDQAAELFGEATEQLLKWIDYLGKGFSNLFEFEYLRFLGDWKKFNKDGILAFEFKVNIWDGALSFEESITIDFSAVLQFIDKIQEFIYNLPALNICKLLKS
jgi:hypothetical protein